MEKSFEKLDSDERKVIVQKQLSLVNVIKDGNVTVLVKLNVIS